MQQTTRNPPASETRGKRGEEAPLDKQGALAVLFIRDFPCPVLRSPISDLRSPISDRPERISGVREGPLLDPDKMSNNNRAYLVAMLVAPLSRIACGLETFNTHLFALSVDFQMPMFAGNTQVCSHRSKCLSSFRADDPRQFSRAAAAEMTSIYMIYS